MNRPGFPGGGLLESGHRERARRFLLVHRPELSRWVLPIGSRSRRLLNHSTQLSISNSTAIALRHGRSCSITPS